MSTINPRLIYATISGYGFGSAAFAQAHFWALGEHSVEVLKSIGYSANEIGALEKAGVVRTQNFRP